MSKEVKKISEEHLKEIQDNQAKMVKLINNIGGLEAQKQDYLNQVPAVRKEMDEIRVKLEEVYGPVNININDGTYEEIPEEHLSKMKKVD